jgi:hypothetical protein
MNSTLVQFCVLARRVSLLVLEKKLKIKGSLDFFRVDITIDWFIAMIKRHVAQTKARSPQ